jgi:hypothetical protein
VLAAGYDAAFMSLGAVGGVGLAVYLLAMPETADRAAADAGRTARSASPSATDVAAPKR